MSLEGNESKKSARFLRGPGGRPTRAEAERRHLRLLAAATRLFTAKGLAGISIDAIAEEAGVAKRFVYARYRDKGELFVAAVKRLIEERVGFVMTYQVSEAPVEAGLLAFAEKLERAAVHPDAMAMHRIIVTELHRFPALGRLFTEKTRQNVLGGIVRILQTYEARGEIKLDDPFMSAELFFMLIGGSAQRRALIRFKQTAAQRRHRTFAAVRLFLDGVRPRGGGRVVGSE
ncbi:MAG: TetR/AcrR family transcriptional regulator [Methylobacteriaceae bacterium]|nr:TetR/AcrR family transcriptional regulator [Methylobacteriaceae bacterium]MBV9243210.1 TetR/AcrR family transcriptional regulator [Methylobacteriaceae bacterium]MBV9702163.1 TetR/AcrR family transcriptional regulator [Methylobacteriaceae bacterium]